MVFVPKTREIYASRVGRMVHELSELAEETPIATAIHLLTQQLGGWPTYLTVNVTGHNCHEKQIEGRGKGKKNGPGGGVNHFDPASPLYEAKDANLILLSDLGLLIVGGILFTLGQKFGWTNMLVWYFLPYLWVNHWLGTKFPSLLFLFANLLQLPSHSSSTPIPHSLITPRAAGTMSVGQRLPSIASSDSSAVPFFMVSSRLTSFTTMSAPSLSTMRMRQPRQSSLSWVSTTGAIQKMAAWAS